MMTMTRTMLMVVLCVVVVNIATPVASADEDACSNLLVGLNAVGCVFCIASRGCPPALAIPEATP